MLKEIHFASSVRTPFGSFCGAFADLSAAELGKAAVERSGMKPEDVKELLSILLALTKATFRKIPYER
jgi:acetyl-CoA acetyltransferase